MSDARPDLPPIAPPDATSGQLDSRSMRRRAHVALRDLSRRGAGQRVDDDEAAGHLEVGEPGAGVGLDRLEVGARAPPGRRPPSRPGPSADRASRRRRSRARPRDRRGRARRPVEKTFSPPVFTTSPGAVDEIDAAVGVDAGEVAGSEPAVAERRRRRLGVLPVTRRHGGAAGARSRRPLSPSRARGFRRARGRDLDALHRTSRTARAGGPPRSSGRSRSRARRRARSSGTGSSR